VKIQQLIIAITSLSALLFYSRAGKSEQSPNKSILYQAMTHKDQDQPEPLLTSLSARIGHIEVDIFLDEATGQLLVGHDRDELDPVKNLESMYLGPLKDWADTWGIIYPEGSPLNLYVDVKSDASKTYIAIHNLLKNKYSNLVSRVERGRFVAGHLNVVITGNRDWEAIKSEKIRFVSIDGRLSDLGQHYPPNLVPMISDNWKLLFPDWQEGDALSSRQRQIIKGLAFDAGLNGQYLRFWATPEDPQLWSELLRLGGGTIVLNTDKPVKLSRFLSSKGDHFPFGKVKSVKAVSPEDGL